MPERKLQTYSDRERKRERNRKIERENKRPLLVECGLYISKTEFATNDNRMASSDDFILFIFHNNSPARVT